MDEDETPGASTSEAGETRDMWEEPWAAIVAVLPWRWESDEARQKSYDAYKAAGRAKGLPVPEEDER